MDKSKQSSLPHLNIKAKQKTSNTSNNQNTHINIGLNKEKQRKIHIPTAPPMNRAPRPRINTNKANESQKTVKITPHQEMQITNHQSQLLSDNNYTNDNDNNDYDEFDSLQTLSVSNHPTYKSILFTSIKKNKEYVIFVTFAEFDLHGNDVYILDAFDWVIHIRDAVLCALEQEVDFFNFIPGRGNPHKKLNPKTKQFEIIQKEPTLRPLVLITLKRMGFDCYQKEDNEGYFICPISSYKCNTEDEEVIRNQKSLYKLFGCEQNIFDDDQDNIIKKSYIQVMNHFPTMPKFCGELIALWKKDPSKSITCAEKFEKYYKSKYIDLKNDKVKLKLLEKENIESIHNNQKDEFEEGFTNQLCNYYHFDPLLVKRIVHEIGDMEKIIEILNRITLMKSDYLIKFGKLVQKYSFIPIISLLEKSEEFNHEYSKIQRYASSHSVMQFEKAVKVLKLSTKITSDRVQKYQPKDFTKPKLILSIEINVEHAGKEKAMCSISRTIDALGTSEIGEMKLVFSDNKNDENICKSDEILPLIMKKVENNYFIHIDKEKGNEIYHCYIKPKTNDI